MNKIIGMLFLACLVLFGCNTALDDSVSQTGGSKVAVPIRIQDQNVSARTVMPEVSLDDITRYVLECTEVGKEILIDSWEFTAAEIKNASIEIEAGTWDFELLVYKGESSEPYLYGGIYNRTISSSKDTLDFVLTAGGWKEGKGNVHIIIDNLDAGIVSAEVQLGTSAKTSLPIKDGKIEYKAEVDVDDYLTKFYLKDGSGEVVRVVSEMIHVRTGLTSKKTITLPELPAGEKLQSSITIELYKDLTLTNQSISIGSYGDIRCSVQEEYESYQWYLDGKTLSDAIAGTCTIQSQNLAAGVHELTVVATDQYGEKLSGRCRIIRTN